MKEVRLVEGLCICVGDEGNEVLGKTDSEFLKYVGGDIYDVIKAVDITTYGIDVTVIGVWT